VPDQPTDAPIGLTDRGARPSRSPHIARTDWRLGGRTVTRWREWLLATAFISLGVSILAATLVTSLWQSQWAAASALVLLWIGMLVPIVAGFSRSRPAGLLRFRALDLLYGVVLGALLRLVQGSLDAAAGVTALPTYPLVDGALPSGWVLTDGIGATVIAPVIEEFFFRGVLLIALYTVLRRPFGKPVAGFVTLLATTGVFVLVHGLTAQLSVGTVGALTLLGLVCGLLVLLTGRIWGAVLVHAFFNATWVALAIVGTIFA
jgi:membrane protease YdiL (CAAX protease family)